MPALSVSGLTKSYGSFAVINGLNLQLERGSIYGFERETEREAERGRESSHIWEILLFSN